MWEIKILTVGKVKNEAIKKEVERLQKKVRGEWKVEISSIPDSTEKNPEIRKKKETGELLLKTPKECSVIPLDQIGKMVSSEDFSSRLSKYKDEGRKVCFLIGGAYGLDSTMLSKAEEPLSLSKMTFSHELSLVMLMEQIYRGYTLYNNIPYSK